MIGSRLFLATAFQVTAADFSLTAAAYQSGDAKEETRQQQQDQRSRPAKDRYQHRVPQEWLASERDDQPAGIYIAADYGLGDLQRSRVVLEPELAKHLARFVRHAQIQPHRIERHEADHIPEYAKAVANHEPSVSLQRVPFKRKLRGSGVNWIFRCGDGLARLICGKGTDSLRRIGSGNGPTREGWPSGLRRTPGKRVGVKAPPGFESPSLRHTPIIYVVFHLIKSHLKYCLDGIISYFLEMFGALPSSPVHDIMWGQMWGWIVCQVKLTS